MTGESSPTSIAHGENDRTGPWPPVRLWAAPTLGGADKADRRAAADDRCEASPLDDVAAGGPARYDDQVAWCTDDVAEVTTVSAVVVTAEEAVIAVVRTPSMTGLAVSETLVTFEVVAPTSTLVPPVVAGEVTGATAVATGAIAVFVAADTVAVRAGVDVGDVAEVTAVATGVGEAVGVEVTDSVEARLPS